MRYSPSGLAGISADDADIRTDARIAAGNVANSGEINSPTGCIDEQVAVVSHVSGLTLLEMDR